MDRAKHRKHSAVHPHYRKCHEIGGVGAYRIQVGKEGRQMIGVYKITNSVSGKIYVGSTTGDFRSRWSSHKSNLRKGCHCVAELQKDWNDLGESCFTFEILEAVENKKDVPLAEQMWIAKAYKSGNYYNVSLHVVRSSLLHELFPFDIFGKKGNGS
jgi:hypothetical protein